MAFLWGFPFGVEGTRGIKNVELCPSCLPHGKSSSSTGENKESPEIGWADDVQSWGVRGAVPSQMSLELP